MKYYALLYDLGADYLSRRSQYREQHLRLAGEANRRGELLLAGALTDPTDRALLVFRAPDRSVVEAFARNDPYVTNELVTRWEVRPWAVVIGRARVAYRRPSSWSVTLDRMPLWLVSRPLVG